MATICGDGKRERTRAFTGLHSHYLFQDRFGRPGIRMPQVHDWVKQGFATYLLGHAREKGVSAYVGDGVNCWPAVHWRSTAWMPGGSTALPWSMVLAVDHTMPATSRACPLGRSPM